MEIVNIHEAKTHLSRLVDQAVKGEPFIIAKAGKPLVKVTALNSPRRQKNPKTRFHGRPNQLSKVSPFLRGIHK